jgi:hypothetical protein
MEISLTAEQIARHYASTMDSVTLVTGAKPAGVSDTDWADVVSRNKEHIQLMLEKSFWTAEHDLAPFKAAVAAKKK